MTLRVNLEGLLHLIQVNAEKNCWIQECWLDYGAGIWHRTIVMKANNSFHVQVLTANEASEANIGWLTIEEAEEIVERVKTIK